jgi:ketopantoate reductase
MNERIRELAEQAGAEFEKTNGLNDCPQDSLVGDEIQAFAESIIKECLSIADRRGAYQVMDDIIERFGVEL